MAGTSGYPLTREHSTDEGRPSWVIVWTTGAVAIFILAVLVAVWQYR